MKEEIKRINKLVAEGKLSPEDAADLIEAFVESSTRQEAAGEPASGEEPSAPPPPPPPGEPDYAEAQKPKDAFRTFFDSFEKLIEEGKDAVKWEDVAKQAKVAAKEGIEKLKTGLDDLSKGKVNLGWLNAQESRQIDLPLSLPEGKTLQIENLCGDVKVVGGAAEPRLIARAHFRGSTNEDARARAEAYTIMIEEADHAVSVKQPDVVGLVVEIEAHVPAQRNVEIKVESGDVNVDATHGGVRVVSRSGDVKLHRVDGPITIQGESGDILLQDATSPSASIENKAGDVVIRQLKGVLNVRSATGDIIAEEVAGKVISVESVSGDVRVELAEPVSGSVNIRTVNGTASVAVPDGSDCRVSLSTLRGEVASGIPLEDEARSDHRITGRLGSGNGTLDVSAVTGGVSLELRAEKVE